jgi:hypothetical protein
VLAKHPARALLGLDMFRLQVFQTENVVLGVAQAEISMKIEVKQNPYQCPARGLVNPRTLA